MAKKKKIKRPQRGKAKNIKPPNVDEKISYDSKPPIFSLRYLVKSHDLDKCELNEKAAFADKLCQLGKVEWRQLRQAPRHGIGYEKITRNTIRPGIPHHITEDVDFIAFRFYNKAPMVGYRDRQVFHVVWLDRGFNVYPYG